MGKNIAIIGATGTGKTTDAIQIGNSVDFENKLVFDINKEYTNIYIPSYFIATTADTFYFKISFFNATNGKLRFFECSTTDSGSLKNYFKLKLNKTNKTYEILNGDILVNTPQSKTYKISEVIEPIKESKITDQSSIPRIRPLIKTKTTITARGTFVW